MTEDKPLHAVGENVPDLAVGLFGPRAIVKVMVDEGKTVAARHPRQAVRFLAAGHADLSEAADRYVRLADRIDVAVFPGPMHYDLARAAGYLSVPSSYVRLSGAALYSTLLRGRVHGELDLTRISIDSLSHAAVEEAYEEIDVPSSGVRCSPYADPESALLFAEFHRPLLQSGEVTMALTTILSVEQELRSEGFPVMRIQPTRATIREALETAVLLGHGSKLGEQQIAMIAVQVLTEGSLANGSSYWQQEAALSVHRLLLAEARTAGATVARRGDASFVLTTTFGGLDSLTAHLQHAPFINAIQQRLGLPVAVGIGVGNTARDAEGNALVGLEGSLERRGEVAVYVDGGDAAIVLTAPTSASDEPAVSADRERERAVAVLERILAAHPAAGDQPPVVGVEEVSSALGVTDRTGRRLLKQLVEAGLAWPLPPVAPPGGGRPRLQFRLLPDSRPATSTSLFG